MTLTLPDVLIAVVLFACVPVQYFIVQKWGSSESSRSYALNTLVNWLSTLREKYLEAWRGWGDPPDEGESPAIEVMQYRHKHGYFSFSPEARLHRPPRVTFRVGQVVAHKTWKYRGVIVGWDERAKAPPEWLDEMHGTDHLEWREMPNYSILVDTRDRLSPQLTYVPQDNLRVIKDSQVIHPLLDKHFESFDGAQYIPRPWLKALYPED